MNCLELCRNNNSYSHMNKSAREKEAVLSVFSELVRPLMRVAFEYGISAGEIAGVVRDYPKRFTCKQIRSASQSKTDFRTYQESENKNVSKGVCI